MFSAAASQAWRTTSMHRAPAHQRREWGQVRERHSSAGSTHVYYKRRRHISRSLCRYLSPAELAREDDISGDGVDPDSVRRLGDR